jgi:predicted ATP-grasp superfamily ATP-dependent carboligase
LPAAVVVGAGGGELPVVRSLGLRRVRVWLAAPARTCAASSRYVRGFFPVPSPLEAPGEFAEQLLEMGGAFDERPVLIAVDDAAVAAVAASADRLAGAYHLTGPAPPVVREILDKGRQYERVLAAGIPLPPTWLPEGAGEAARIASEARFPVVVKPRFAQSFRAAHGFKAVRVDTPLELEAALTAFGEAMIVQEAVPGGVERVYEYGAFVDRAGLVRVEASMRKLEEDPDPYGSAIAAEALREPALSALGRRVLEVFAYRGTAHSEFKRDPRDDRLLFIELNPRMPISASLQRAAGADTVWPAYAEAAGLSLDPPVPVQSRVVWLRPELRLTRRGRLRPPARLADSPAGRTRYVADLLEPRDPGPLLSEALTAIRRRLEWLRRELPGALAREISMRCQSSAHPGPWILAHRLGALALRWREPWSLHRGVTRDGSEIAVVGVGARTFQRPLLERIFVEVPAGISGGRIGVMRPPAPREPPDVMAVRIHPWRVGAYRRAGWRVFPSHVRFVCDPRRPIDVPKGRPGRSVANDLHRLHRFDYALEEVDGRVGWEEFRSKMYVPHLSSRFGAGSIHTATFKRLASRARLLFVTRDGTRVAGVLAVPCGETIWIPALGLLHGSPELLRQGALIAAYILGVQWAGREGYRLADWGHALPFRDDGIHRFKRKWGFEPVPSAVVSWIAVRAWTPVGLDALARLPLALDLQTTWPDVPRSSSAKGGAGASS